MFLSVGRLPGPVKDLYKFARYKEKEKKKKKKVKIDNNIFYLFTATTI